MSTSDVNNWIHKKMNENRKNSNEKEFKKVYVDTQYYA